MHTPTTLALSTQVGKTVSQRKKVGNDRTYMFFTKMSHTHTHTLEMSMLQRDCVPDLWKSSWVFPPNGAQATHHLVTTGKEPANGRHSAAHSAGS